MDTVQQVVVPELTGKNADQVMEVAAECNLIFELAGTGMVMYQQPSPGVMVDIGSKILVGFEEAISREANGDMAGP
jgi:hypothetical protein